MDRLTAVRTLFKKQKIATLDELKQAMGTTGTMTVFRRLKELGYRTSYSHRGKYYTLADIPQFDQGGLWSYQSVRFSRLGNLLHTTREFVERAAAGFTAAEAPRQAAHSYLHLAELEVKAGRQSEGRDSYLSAANSLFAVREKNQELWATMIQALEQAIDLSLALEEASLAIELLYKTAIIQYRETGFTLDAIYSLERAQQLLEQVPNHPLAQDINEKLQELVDYQT